jgi:hypothetical protein
VSTIYGPIKLADNTPYIGDILFRPISTPIADAPDLIVSTDIKVTTDGQGEFSTVLRVGNYKVFFGTGDKALLITVPDDELSYPLLSRVNSRLQFQVSEPPFSELRLLEQVASGAVQITSATFDGDGILSSAVLKWLDGSAGVLTVTSRNLTFSVPDAWTMTHVNASRIITQAAVTRNDIGDILTQPALTIAPL